ncbi:MAG: flagellar export protein FliJ [Bacterioplanes sp.]|nr:flagellar export protein FliJ [Bacterioplanes sp.]
MARHPRAKRLQVVLDLAQRAEQAALKSLAHQQQALLAEQQQKDQLLIYADEYQRQLSTPTGSAIQAGQLRNTMGFLQQIETAIKGQAQQLSLLQQRVEAARNEWLRCQGKVKALQSLLDKLDIEYAQEQDRRQQVEADEWSNRMAFQRIKR